MLGCMIPAHLFCIYYATVGLIFADLPYPDGPYMFDTPPTYKGLKIGHYDVRSLHPKVDSIRHWLSENTFDCLTISQTWLTPAISNGSLGLNDYEICRLDRATGCRGGTADDLQKEQRLDRG